jgi:hypothetical protein
LARKQIEQRKMNHAATKLQALCRGRAARKLLASLKEVTRIGLFNMCDECSHKTRFVPQLRDRNAAATVIQQHVLQRQQALRAQARRRVAWNAGRSKKLREYQYLLLRLLGYNSRAGQTEVLQMVDEAGLAPLSFNFHLYEQAMEVSGAFPLR